MKYTVFWRYMVDYAEELRELAVFYDVSNHLPTKNLLEFCQKRLEIAKSKT